MMAKFEDQLFDDLMRSHGSALDTVPDRAVAGGRRRVGRTLGVGGTALGAVGVVALTGTLLTSGSVAAYAVSKDADGVVRVSITDITGVTGANEELRRLGVRAVAVPVRDGCVDMKDLPVDHDVRGSGMSADADGSGGGALTFDADDIPEGDTMLLAATQSSTSVSLGAALIKGAAPECVSMPAPPAGSVDQGREVRSGAPESGFVQEGGS
ncbi:MULTISPECIES: hypothetical protein [unclassified Saccharothrix]|uniref:hypothetical protein n=1 Tax=unclassified Saccharothrix TaxID=2593673 RepID=UPI00307D9690